MIPRPPCTCSRRAALGTTTPKCVTWSHPAAGTQPRTHPQPGTRVTPWGCQWGWAHGSAPAPLLWVPWVASIPQRSPTLCGAGAIAVPVTLLWLCWEAPGRPPGGTGQAEPHLQHSPALGRPRCRLQPLPWLLMCPVCAGHVFGVNSTRGGAAPCPLAPLCPIRGGDEIAIKTATRPLNPTVIFPQG